MPAKFAQVPATTSKRVVPQAGEVLGGKFRVERVIGEGGMGVVLAAHHMLLDQRVAVKLLDADDTEDTEAHERLLREARAVASLQSEHVARVMDIATLPNGAPFVVMEYLEGFDLSALLRDEGPLLPAKVATYVLQALDALAQAHAQGIIHRDLKPSNLFLTTRVDGSIVVKVLDFGISKQNPVKRREKIRTSTLTGARAILGSPPYMSPEQLRTPRDIDPRSDVWGLGILMYELLTDRLPFEGEEVGELFAAILETKPPSLCALRRDFPEGFDRVVFKCLERERDDRYKDVGEVARALAPYAEGDFAMLIARIEHTLERAKDSNKWTTRDAIAREHGIARREASTNRRRDSLGEFKGTASTLRGEQVTTDMRSRRPMFNALVVATIAICTIGLVAFAWTWRHLHASSAPEPALASSAPESTASALPQTAPSAATSASVATPPSVASAIPTTRADPPTIRFEDLKKTTSRAQTKPVHPVDAIPNALNGRE